MPCRLLAALALTVVVAACGGSGGSTGTGTSPPTPTPAPATASPGAPFLPPDDVTVNGREGFGHLTLQAIGGPARVLAYGLQLRGTPTFATSGPVWSVGTLTGADISVLGAKFGVTSPPHLYTGSTSDYYWSVPSGGSMEFYPDPGRLTWRVNFPGLGAVATGMRIESAADAIRVSHAFLESRSLLPGELDGGTAAPYDQQTAMPTGPGAGPTTPAWVVKFVRHLDGVEDDSVLGSGTAGAMVEVDQAGEILSVDIRDQRVSGGSLYSLTTWQAAWAQVRAGRWFGESGQATGTGAGAAAVPLFTATAVRIVLLDPSSASDGIRSSGHLIPMYAFTSADASLTLYYPAIASADLTYNANPPTRPAG